MKDTRLVRLPSLPSMSRGPRAKTHACDCGCGLMCGNRFVPGHDSRLRGWALRLERGLVGSTPSTFPGTKGELEAALAELKRTGRKPATPAAPKAEPKPRLRKSAKPTPPTTTEPTATE